MCDWDNDGLLNHDEMENFQKSIRLNLRDMNSWDQIISERLHDHGSLDDIVSETIYVRDGKFTLAGFIAIFEAFISQNRLDIPWKILRMFGYDDMLELIIPDRIYEDLINHDMKGHLKSLAMDDSCGLSLSAKQFLTRLFLRYDPECSGYLSKQNLKNIFSIVPQRVPPWHPDRHVEAFSNSFSSPKLRNQFSEVTSISSFASGPSLSASGISIGSLGSLSSVDTNDNSIDLNNDFSRSLTFQDWMGHWYLMSSLSSAFTRKELYRLGYDAENTFISTLRKTKQYSCSSTHSSPSIQLPSRATRIFLFGSNIASERKKIVEFLLRSNETDSISYNLSCPSMSDDVSSSRDSNNFHPPSETWYASIHMKRYENHRDRLFVEEHISYLIITEISDAKRMNNLRDIISNVYDRKCDLVVLAFDSVDVASAEYVLQIERDYLSHEVPRVFLAVDEDQSVSDVLSCSKTSYNLVRNHCISTCIEIPFLVSTIPFNDGRRQRVLVYLSQCALKESRLDVIPSGQVKERNAKKLWVFLGGITFVISVGFYYNLTSYWNRDKDSDPDKTPTRLRWFRNLFSSALRSELINE
jgi:hypothetical protein